MEKKEGKYPANARVDVDYSKGKPKIKFAYPGNTPKKDAIRQGGLTTTFVIIWIVIGIIPFFMIIYSISPLQTYQEYPTECGNLTFDKVDYNMSVIYQGTLNHSYNYSLKRIYGFNITCDNEIYKVNYYKSEGYFKSEESTNYIISLGGLWFYLSLFISIYLNRLVTRYLIKKKWYQRWLPKANAEGVIFKTRIKKYYKFLPKDVLENVIVIPRFSNVELDYKTEGDFSKQLQGIKIREYRERKIKLSSKKVSKEKIDKFKWYAIFYFKEKPKTGYLEVIYQ